MINLYTRISSFIILLFLAGNLSAQFTDTLSIEIQCSNSVQGNQQCFEFRASEFEGLEALSFSISYDPSVLQYVNAPIVTNSCLKDLEPTNINFLKPGSITFLWIEGPDTLEEDCLLFSLCFNFIGSPGECSNISIGNYPTEISVVTPTGDGFLNTVPCEACVLASECTIVASYCNPTTPSSNDGSITFYAIGGVPPYNYTFVGPPNIPLTSINANEPVTIPNLGYGTYTISIEDQVGCTKVRPVGIFDPGKPTVDIKTYLPTCTYRNDGQIKLNNINVTNLPYEIKWDIGFYNEDSIPALYPGVYKVTITDANGCEIVNMVDLTIPVLDFNATIIDSAFCLGKPAQIEVNASGGFPFPGNSYNVKLGNNIGVITPMPAIYTDIITGKLKITISDNAINYLGNSNPCVVEKEFVIPYKNKTQYQVNILDDVSCKGDMDGHVDVTMSGTGTRFRLVKEVFSDGTPLTPSGAMGPDKYFNDSLAPGSYYIITASTQPAASAGCMDTFRFEIKEPVNPLIVSAVVQNATCSGPGNITINASGGAPPYSYNWMDTGLDTDNQRPNLAAATYMVTVSDFNGCDTVLSLSVLDIGTPPGKPVVQQAVSCKNFSDGQATVVGTIGNPTFAWEDAMGNPKGNTITIINLQWGWYYVTITDNGCSSVDSVFLVNPDGLAIVDVEKITPECPGDNFLGSIGVTVEGGAPSYNFVWRNVNGTQVGSNNSVLASITPSTYTVRVSDQNNCFIDTTIILDDVVDFNIALSGLVNISCNGLIDGQATATATLGPINNGKYSFFWSSGEQSQSSNFNRHAAFNLKEGENWVFVTDSKCKSDTVFFNLTAPPAIVANASTSGLCSGSCTGQINLTVTGGSSNNTFKPTVWPTINQTGNTLFNLCEGSYPFVIEDNNGCELRDTVILNGGDSIKVTLDENLSQLLSCRNNIGQLAVNVVGGKPNYTYNWTNNASTTNIASNLSQGIYSVTVTDDSGCTATFSYTLIKPNEIVAVIAEPESPGCNGGKTCIDVVSVTGGTGNTYTMQINNGLRIPIDTCYETFAGNYLINIYDEAGCKSVDYPISISQPNPIIVELGEDIEINLGEETPLIESFVSSDEVIVSYNWSGTDSIFCADPTCTAVTLSSLKENIVLSLLVVDENGCTGEDELNILVTDRRNVYIPNIFKPSGNASLGNQRFDLTVGFGVVLVDELLIYDRWGSIVFANRKYMPDETTGWDGTLNGQNLLPGVYVYSAKVNFLDGQTRIYRGDVTLIK